MPNFKIGDYVIFKLSYAKVLYLIENISVYPNKVTGKKTLFYRLKGIEVLEQLSNSKIIIGKVNLSDHSLIGNINKYTPFCNYFDKTAILYEPNSVKYIKEL